MDIPFDTTNITIETERLLLRGFKSSDLEDFYAYASVPGVGENAGWPHHESLEISKTILDSFLEEKESFAIVHKADGKVIGSLGVHKSWLNGDGQYKDLKSKEIGYVIAKEYWGQGLAAEATKKVIDYGFTVLGLDAFSCCHFTDNHQSRRVIEKSGFKFLKYGKYYAKQLDKTFDDMKYIMLKPSPLEKYYANYNEDARLEQSHGKVEFLTTMRYVKRYLPPADGSARVIEIGAGTGRYSRAIADMGYQVEAVELVQDNIDVFRKNMKPGQKINISQGNALDLPAFPGDAFDVTLLLGPMYHLYTDEDKRRALSEALRITKPGGVVFAAYCISDGTIIEGGFQRKIFDVADYIRRGKIDPENFGTVSVPEDVFELVRKEDIDRLMENFNVTRLHYVATDLFARYIRGAVNEMDGETFALFMKYHFAVCERADMAGVSHHVLDVFRKWNAPSDLLRV